MKTYSKKILTFFLLMLSYSLFAQQTSIEITDYQYNSVFRDGRCGEYVRVTAYFSTGQPARTFIDYTNGNTSAADRTYTVPGTVDRLTVAVYARDRRGGSIFGCFGGNEFIQETYTIPIDVNSCDANTIAHTNNYGTQVTQSFSFNYKVSTAPRIRLSGTFNISDNTIGYEEPISLSAEEGFNESTYQWQYSFNGIDDWNNIPAAPSRTLDTRLIDFLDDSVVGGEIFFRITNCDGNGISNIIQKRVRAYGQMTKINIDNYNYYARFDDGRCEDEIRLTAYFSDGTSRRFIRHRNQRTGRRADREFILEGVVERIDVYMYGKDRVNFGIFGGRRCGRGSLGGRVRRTYTINLDVDPCDSGSFYRRQSDSNDFIGGNEVRQILSFDYKITPLPKISRPSISNIIGYEDLLSLNAQEGFNDSVYDWQYSFLEGNPPFVWTDLAGPSSATREIILADIFDESIIGREIFFRTYSCDGDGSQNVIGYEVRKSAPRVIDVATTPVSCYDATDGSITLTYDTPLTDGDVFGFTVSDQSTPEGLVVATVNNVTAFGDNNEITIDNLPPSDTEFLIEMIGVNNGEPYYTGGPDRTIPFRIERPAPVAFVDEPVDNAVNVYCYGGQDGTITLNAEGGLGGYEYLMRREDESWDDNEWVPFSATATHTIENLFPDTYYIKIQDSNGCVAKRQAIVDGEIELGEELIQRVVITQPDAPLFITTEILNMPTANGFEDGRILATITGGTPFDGPYYEFEWRDENNNLVTTTNTVYNNGQGYLVTLHSIGEGEYTVIARDSNYSSATDTEGCTMTSETITLIQPPPLEVSIEVFPISCNPANSFSNNVDTNYDGIADQFQDGVLVATVTGGTPFDLTNPDYSEPVPTNSNGDLLPYFYYWKMQLPDGSWQDISTNDNIIDFLDTATNYALNVTDKNGIILGRYVSVVEADGSRGYVLDEAQDVVEYLPQPEALALEFRKTDVTCANGNDATLEVIVTGGTAPYTYRWNNGEDDSALTNLIAGTYLVFVTDANGCEIEGNMTIDQSNSIDIEAVTVVSPTCFEGSDGQIEINVEGGVPPYRYLWNTGSRLNQINGLTSGTYRVEVTDASGCRAFFEETLVAADPVLINIEGKRSLCRDQSLELDIRIDDPNATYSWSGTNGFSSNESSVVLTEAGVYTATVTTGTGCVESSEVIVETFDLPIDSNFYLTTQAYAEEDVVLINVSNPIGEIVEWDIPEGTQLVSKSDEELVVRFENEGSYDINLRSYQGDCYQDFKKTIFVEPASETSQGSGSQRNFIQEFILYPNPSNGIFKTKVSLKEASTINVKIIDMVSGATIDEREAKGNQEFLLDYSISMSSGVYLMLLETSNGSETRKLIVE